MSIAGVILREQESPKSSATSGIQVTQEVPALGKTVTEILKMDPGQLPMPAVTRYTTV
jgi:hypothetical protein